MLHKVNGSAGYGKTTELIKQVRSLIASNTPFVVCTPTHKAAMVLNERFKQANLNAAASTYHSRLYSWIATGEVNQREVKVVDSNTGKFLRDAQGKVITQLIDSPVFRRQLSARFANHVLILDESSMIGAEYWYDFITGNLFSDIYAYGDEKQLPPIEDFAELPDEYRPYYRYWHNYQTSVTTLTTNYRQQGELKDFVETIEYQLFHAPSNKKKAIPTILERGENLAIEINDEIMTLDTLKGAFHAHTTPDSIIVTPFVKVRAMANVIARRIRAKQAKEPFSQLPVVGDKIIFVDAYKELIGKIKLVKIPKNTTAVITKIHDCDDTTMCMDITDELANQHFKLQLSIGGMLGVKTSDGCPRIDYAYAVTVHKSQGGQWKHVLYLDGHWRLADNPEKLRYTAITRAQKQLLILTGVSRDEDNRNILHRLIKTL